MARLLLALSLLAMAWGLQTAPAFASGDFTCSPAWNLTKTSLTDCDNQPFLSPGNDSRVNLQLLLLDAGLAKVLPAPAATPPAWTSASPFTLDDFNSLFVAPPSSDDASSDRADGEGSRCLSNAAGEEGFKAALDAARGLPPAEKKALAEARTALHPDCNDASKAVAPPPAIPVRSASGKAFAAYLTGAQAFYAGDYNLAHRSFTDSAGASDPWLRDASRYMLGRTELNRAQSNAFGDYGEFTQDKVDAKALAAAESAFTDYLRANPKGAYAVSARGLLRRVHWLGGQPRKLALDFKQQFDLADPAARNVSELDLVQEADSKLLTRPGAEDVRDPLLLATSDLMRMRLSDTPDGPKPIERAVLEAQRPVFAGHEALFDYLLAAHAYYDEKDPAGALRLLSDMAPSGLISDLDYSRQVLCGLALEASKDPDGARRHWLALLPRVQRPFQRGPIELALALNYERGDALAQVFASGSPIHDPDIRAILLRNVAGAPLLRQRVKAADADDAERRTALTTLLYKELTRGQYQAFLQDAALLPAPIAKPAQDNAPDPDADYAPFRWAGGQDDDGYACPALRDVARTLARDANDAHGRLCLGEWVRVGNLDDDPLDTPPPADQLGGAPSRFPGGNFSRLEVYRQVLASPKAGPNERAYALYRAVNCYAPSGANHCTGPGVAQSQRKAWFHTLKTDYASSRWAQALTYYW